MGFTKPNTESIEYKRLWRNLNQEQRDCLVKYNRIPVRGRDGRLFVIPYSRFNDGEYWGSRAFVHMSVQQFTRTRDGRDIFNFVRCGGIEYTHAASNVLALKLSLESMKQRDYLTQSNDMPAGFSWPLERGMTFEETLEVEVDSIPLLGEEP